MCSSMLCWEGDHITLTVVAGIFVGFYALIMPACIVYALFILGRDGERLNSMHFKVCVLKRMCVFVENFLS